MRRQSRLQHGPQRKNKNHTHSHNHEEEQSQSKLAFSASLHCLLPAILNSAIYNVGTQVRSIFESRAPALAEAVWTSDFCITASLNVQLFHSGIECGPFDSQ